MKKKYKALLNNTLIFAIGNILIKVISFVLMPLYTAFLTTEQYGISELINSLVEITIPIFTLCMVEALFRFSLDEDSNNGLLFVNTLKITFKGILILLFIATPLFIYFKNIYIIYFLVLYSATAIYKITTQFARGLGHVKRYTFYGVFNSLSMVILNIVFLVIYKFGIKGYLLSFIVSYILTSVLTVICSKEYIYLFDKKNNKVDEKKIKDEMIKYSIPLVPNMISWWINNVSDRYIIMFLSGNSAAGIYTAASKLPSMINMVSSIFQQSWQYSTSKEINDKNRKTFFSNVLNIYFKICILTCAILIVFNRVICRILLQSSFFEAWKYVPILLIAATVGCISTYFGTFYQAIKNNKMLMTSTIVGAVLNIIMNFILIPKYGAFGAAYATLASYTIVLIVRMIDITKKIEISIRLKKMIIEFILLLIMMVTEIYLKNVYMLIFVFMIILCVELVDRKNRN